MGRILRYGAKTVGLSVAALIVVPFAGSGSAIARPGHPAMVARAGGTATQTGRLDPTLGRAATLATPPRGATPTAAAPQLKICSFNGTRSRAPFATATGALGYSRMRSALLNPADFGPNGKVHRTVVIAPGIPTITSAALAGCNVFFTSVFTGPLSASEASALEDAYEAGMRVITDADSDRPEAISANSVVTALGFPAPFTDGASCPNAAHGGRVRIGRADPAVYGPFGDLRGNTWGVTPSSVMSDSRAMVRCGKLVVRSVKRHLLVGGDPSGFDLFTSPSEFLFNPTNDAAYLNFIGSAP